METRVFGTDSGYRMNQNYGGQWNPQSDFHEGYLNNGYESARDAPYRPSSVTFSRGAAISSPFKIPALANNISNTDNTFQQTVQFSHQLPHSPPPNYRWQSPTPAAPPTYGPIGSTFRPYTNGDTGRNGHGSFAPEDDSRAHHGLSTLASSPPRASVGVGNGGMPRQSSFSPADSVDESTDASRLSDTSMDSAHDRVTPPSPHTASSPQEKSFSACIESSALRSHGALTGRPDGRSRAPRRGANRDEFDGPHQFLPRPSTEYIAMQERELPHLPTNLLVQEQDSLLSQVNDRLSRCAFDFVARYQFPVPLTQDMRPVARPQDREWTEWVQLLKRLATKRRIPARVLYNGQIKQFVTILENSLEMRHAARHQSRPLKDDRNILQLISAGIQVAKILKDAPAMDFLDRLYVVTEKQIQERSAPSAARFLNGI